MAVVQLIELSVCSAHPQLESYLVQPCLRDGENRAEVYFYSIAPVLYIHELSDGSIVVIVSPTVVAVFTSNYAQERFQFLNYLRRKRRESGFQVRLNVFIFYQTSFFLKGDMPIGQQRCVAINDQVKIIPGEGNGDGLQYSYLGNLMDRSLQTMGLKKSWT